MSDKLTWARTTNQLKHARNYWIATATPDGRPHAAPVWGVWVDGRVVFSTSRSSRKGRNLAANPRVAVHLDSGDDVVILEGVAEEVTDRDLVARVAVAYADKYIDARDDQPFQLEPALADPDAVLYAVRPRTAQAWLEAAFVGSANKWRFTD
jgi:PPOX class probable F420-dependent enzyme